MTLGAFVSHCKDGTAQKEQIIDTGAKSCADQSVKGRQDEVRHCQVLGIASSTLSTVVKSKDRVIDEFGQIFSNKKKRIWNSKFPELKQHFCDDYKT